MTLADEISRLERGIWDRAYRGHEPRWLERVFHADYEEFSSSGRRYVHDDIVAFPLLEFDAELHDMEVDEVAPGVAHVLYRSVMREGGRVRLVDRSSIWVRTSAGWQIRFHQGTPVDDA